MKTLADQWKAFEDLVMHPSAPAIQKREMRRAFYSGAAIMMQMQYDLSEKSEDVFYSILDSWNEEIDQFRKQIQSGDA